MEAQQVQQRFRSDGSVWQWPPKTLSLQMMRTPRTVAAITARVMPVIFMLALRLNIVVRSGEWGLRVDFRVADFGRRKKQLIEMGGAMFLLYWHLVSQRALRHDLTRLSSNFAGFRG